MGDEEIRALIDDLGEIVTALDEADPADKSAVYRQLGLKLTYQPDARVVRAEVNIDGRPWTDRTRSAHRKTHTPRGNRGVLVSVRRGNRPLRPRAQPPKTPGYQPSVAPGLPQRSSRQAACRCAQGIGSSDTAALASRHRTHRSLVVAGCACELPQPVEQPVPHTNRSAVSGAEELVSASRQAAIYWLDGLRAGGQSRRWKMSKATFHSAAPGFFRSGSIVTNVCASATLKPPAISGSRCSVASERVMSNGGRAVS